MDSTSVLFIFALCGSFGIYERVSGDSVDIMLDGWDMDGEIIATISANSSATCLTACKELPACKFGVFLPNPDGNTCSLKSSATAASLTSRRPGSTLVASSKKVLTRKDGALDNMLTDGTLDDNLNFDGSSFLKVQDEEECRKLCAVHPMCNTGVYVHPDSMMSRYAGRCFLRNVVNPSVNPLSDHTSFSSL